MAERIFGVGPTQATWIKLGDSKLDNARCYNP
jgi:hypothetical protein